MTALLSLFPSPVAAVSESVTGATSARAHIKTPKWSHDEIPFEYLLKFEKAMKHNRSEWGQLLPVYLSGKAQASFAQVGEEMLDNYDLVKETMLESLGDTPASADRRWYVSLVKMLVHSICACTQQDCDGYMGLRPGKKSVNS